MANSSSEVKRGAWTEEEDNLLRKCIHKYGEGKWHLVPHRAGLNRCRKSCRLRWMNYLRPNIKRGDFSSDEVDLILRLHKLLGNRWSLIAGRIPGRTANDVKNYWNTRLQKKEFATRFSRRQENRREEAPTSTVNNVIRPRPRRFRKTLSRMFSGTGKITNEIDQLQGYPEPPPETTSQLLNENIRQNNEETTLDDSAAAQWGEALFEFNDDVGMSWMQEKQVKWSDDFATGTEKFNQEDQIEWGDFAIDAELFDLLG